MRNDIQKTVKAISRLMNQIKKKFYPAGRTSVSVKEMERVADLTTRLSDSFRKPLIIEQISQNNLFSTFIECFEIAFTYYGISRDYEWGHNGKPVHKTQKQKRQMSAGAKISTAIQNVLKHFKRHKNKKLIARALEAGGTLFFTITWQDKKVVKEIVAKDAPYVALVRLLSAKGRPNYFEWHILRSEEADAQKKKQQSRKSPCQFNLIEDDVF